MPDELDRERPAMAPPAGGGETAPPLAGHSPGRGPAHGPRAGTGGAAPVARDTQPDRATRCVDTTSGVLSHTHTGPLPADKVLRQEAARHQSECGAWPQDEHLVAEFHRRICHELVPDWAGRWRSMAVRVGQLTPPPSHQVPLHRRDYGADSRHSPSMKPDAVQLEIAGPTAIWTWPDTRSASVRMPSAPPRGCAALDRSLDPYGEGGTFALRLE